MVKHGLMASVLAIISAAPDKCLRQGINHVYQAYEALGFQTSLQPCHIAAFAMTCDPSVDLNVFASLEDHYSPLEARRRRVRYGHYEDKPISLPGASVDLAIIGTNVDRLGRALRAYLGLLGVVYAFHARVGEALEGYRLRMMAFASRHSLGQEYSLLTARLFQICLSEFASELKYLFEAVGGRSVTSADQFVLLTDRLPDTEGPSYLASSLLEIQTQRAVMALSGRGATQRPQKKGATGGKVKPNTQGEGVLKTEENAATASAGRKMDPPYCKYFLSEGGCQSSNCVFRHGMPEKGSMLYQRMETLIARDRLLRPSVSFVNNK
jgi:hypothetical protein